MIRKSGNRFSEKIMHKQKDEIVMRFNRVTISEQNRRGLAMQGKVALEEHFALEETLQDSAIFSPQADWPELKARLLDIQDRRLREMDSHGIEMMLLSLNAPTVQAIPDRNKADELSRRANDFLAEQVQRRPQRFRGLAALPMQNPDLATRELVRCVRELGFCGALVNGFSQIDDNAAAVYYDLKAYWPFWAEVERLDVPFYLHPRNPLPKDAAIYEGHRWLMGPTWAFGQETAVHALRLMGSGLFDAYPKLKIILGHMGEGLPYSMWRVDHRNGWVKAPPKHKAKKKICDCFNSASISENDRHKIGRRNAIDLFKLDLGETAVAGHGIHEAAE